MASLTSITPGNARVGATTAMSVVAVGLGTVAPTVAVPGCTVSAETSTDTSLAFSITPNGSGAVGAATVSVNANWTVTNKALTSNVATLTIGTHTVLVGDTVVVTGVDATFNGTYVVTAVAATTISYALTHADVVSAAATGNVEGPTMTKTISILPSATPTYFDSYPGGAAGASSAAVQSGTETAVFTENPLYNPATEGAPGVNRGQADQYNPVTPPGASDADNPVVALNARIQESDLVGVGLGDYVTPHPVGPFQVTHKALTSNVAQLTFAEAAHPFAVGDVVVVAGVDATFNAAAATITAIGATTISYAVTAANVVLTTATGTVTGTFVDRPRQLVASSV